MTLGSGETSLGEQHRATTESDLPPTLFQSALHEGNLLIDGHPILNFRLFTSTCKVCGKEIIVWRECVRRNNNVYSWSGPLVPEPGGCMTTRDQSTHWPIINLSATLQTLPAIDLQTPVTDITNLETLSTPLQ